MYHLYVPAEYVFILLPLRSVINLFQILWQCIKLRKEYGNLDIYFTMNGFAAWIGLLLRKFGMVDKTIYWVCDYYPLIHKDKAIQAIRWLYWQFEKRTTASDKLTFHNNRIADVWKKNKLLPKDYKATLIPVGTARILGNFTKSNNKKRIRFCFLGVLKKSMGLDYIFDSAELLSKTFPEIVVEIIGPGPDEKYFKKRAKNTPLQFNFYGYLSEDKIDKIISRSSIGIAPYMPDPSNVSYYADSAKMKKYISLGLPVIATKIHEFAEEVERSHAGIMVHYGDSKQLIEAVYKVNSSYSTMRRNVRKLNNKYYYRNIYPKMFDV